MTQGDRPYRPSPDSPGTRTENPSAGPAALPVALAFLVGVALVVGIGTLGPRLVDRLRGESTVAADASLGDQCGSVPATAHRTTVTGDDGRELGGALVGDESARTAVVLRHGASQTICDWLPWAVDLADEAHVRVLLLDRRGQGSSPGDPGLAHEPDDLVRAVGHIRSTGTEKVVLVASSLGNAVTFAGLDRVPSPVCSVVAISPVLTASDGSGRVDGRSPSTLPGELFTTWESGNRAIEGNATRLAALAEEQGTRVSALPVETDDHGLALVRNHDEVRDFVTDAVASCA